MESSLIQKLDRCLLSSHPILFTGAGFSLGATNGNGEAIPSGNVLKKNILIELLGFKENSDEYDDGIGYFVVLLTMLFTFVTDFGMTEKIYDAQMKRKILMMKIWNAVLIFGTACLVWTALYLDFTPVGSMVINGVSPRYYLPLIFPLSFIFINQKVRCNMKLENYQRLVAFLMLIGTGISIYCLMLA